MGQNQAFFVSRSLSLTVCFFLGSKLDLVWHSHVRYWWIKDWVWVLGWLWSMRTERTEHECVYTWMSPQYCFLCYYYCFAAAMLCWLAKPICMREDNALTLIDFSLLYFTSQAAWFLGFWVRFSKVTKA